MMLNLVWVTTIIVGIIIKPAIIAGLILWYNYIMGVGYVSKGARIFYMFFVLLVIMIAVDTWYYNKTGITYLDELEIFLVGLVFDLILSVFIICLWDYVSIRLDVSNSPLWRIFKGAVVSTSWFLAAIVAIMIIFGILSDMNSQGFLTKDFIKIIFILWGIITIINAIYSLKKDS